MAKHNDIQQSIPTGNVFVTPIEEVMPQSLLPYAEFVILDRALPRVEDGLKPVQRRILYTMIEMGLTPDKPHKKSARIVGDCMGKYHPHGDSSVYEAMVRMAQDFNMRMTLVNGHGNFGDVDGDPAAAMRYTEARLEPLAMELLRDLDKETVPFSFNFDDSLMEPDILPGRFPNLLVNGANGIAVGVATSIPTHNLGEVIDGVCAFIDNDKITLPQLMKHIPGPDFSTGGYIVANELVQAYETGRGKITLRAKYHVELGERGQKLIVFTELPYQTNKADLLRKILSLKEDKKETFAGIADIVDESDRTGMRAVVACKKDADVDGILSLLFKYTDLECTFGINMVAIAGGRPQQLGLIDIIRHYVNYQQQVIKRRTKFELKEAEARCHILEGLIVGVHNIDEVVRIIKTSESTAVARANLMETFSLTQIQAQAILDLRLARLAKLEVTKLEKELADLQARIQVLKAILASKAKQMDIVKQELLEIKRKYPCPRKTVIVQEVQDIVAKREDVKRPTTDWAICLTSANTVKFIEKPEFTSKSKRDLPSSAPKSGIFKQVLFTSSDKKLYLMTNLGNCAVVSLPDYESSDFRAIGYKLEELCKSAVKGEEIVKMFVIGDTLPQGELIFFTKDGMAKRSEWADYGVSQAYFLAVKLKLGDKVVNVEQFDPDEFSSMLFVTKRGNVLNASKDDVPTQGRVATGVKGIILNEGDEVVSAFQQNGEGEIVVVTSANGFKRVIASLLDQLPRARKGVMIADIKDQATILFADYVTLPYALAVVNEDKTVVQMSTEQIPIEVRTTKGKPIKGLPITQVAFVVALKHKQTDEGSGMQISF